LSSLAGSLTVVGTGIRAGIQLTPEAREAVARSDEVLFLVPDPVAAALVRALNPRARSLHHLYRRGEPRRAAYEAMVEEILQPVRDGAATCAAFYGHPGVFTAPAHEAIRQAQTEGYEARMLPGISAEDCLFADLGFDPGPNGCQSYEATVFLRRRPSIDTGALLILWQVTVLGRDDYVPEPDLSALPELAACLSELYSPEHEVILYEASPYPVGEPAVLRVPVAELAEPPFPRLATLVVPPMSAAQR
jgi:uncharacterized protein YabN with tetrapyrrole methylase and pyrophosphatase domain